jgi:transposase
VRFTSILRTLLQLEHTVITAIEFDDEGVIVEVKPTWRVPRCSGCGMQERAGYDRYQGRRWRHLDLCGMKLYLQYDVRRIKCRRCGVRVEEVPFAAAGSWFTYAFEDQVGFLAQRTDKTTVCELMRVAWSTVGDIVQRVVERHGPADRLDGLVHIGVDELSVRRHHKYITVVVDHDKGRIVWAGEGKSADALDAFFSALGPERCALIRVVTMDMSKAYAKAVSRACPQATQTLDRFHVQKLVHDALDEVRRGEVRDATDQDAARALKKTRWALQKNPWNLRDLEARKLSHLQHANKRLYRAYLLKESLLEILDRKQVNVARCKLDEWRAWASRSRLPPFKRLARTITTHLDGILAYVRNGLSNGWTEALNGKIRTLTRRAYGFHSASALISLIWLCCGGISLRPVHAYPPL